MWEPVALCCFTRKAGCLVMASLELIGAIIFLVWGTISLVAAENVFGVICGGIHPPTQEMAQTEQSQAMALARTSCENEIRVIIDSIIGVLMIFALVQLVCASMMIHGVRKNDHCLMTPYLIKNAVYVGLAVIIGCVGAAFLCVLNFLAVVVFAYCYGSLVFMWSYFLLTARAYYYEVKLGKADDHHRLVENPQLEINTINNL